MRHLFFNVKGGAKGDPFFFENVHTKTITESNKKILHETFAAMSVAVLVAMIPIGIIATKTATEMQRVN